MQNKNIFQAFCATVLLAVAGVASATTLTSNLSVTANVAAVCSISTTAVGFGAYDPVTANAAAPLNATGGVTIACTKGAAPTITLGLGSNATGSTRRMLGGTSGGLLTYELYQQPSTTVPATACSYVTPTVWGTSGANIFTPSASPGKAARTYNVCGQVAAGQDVPVDASYTDTVVASVNF